MTFALAAALPVGASDWWLMVVVPVGVVGVLCWGAAPILTLPAIVLFVQDPWRRQRSRHERARLALLVFGSPVAWLLSNWLNDTYHLLR